MEAEKGHEKVGTTYPENVHGNFMVESNTVTSDDATDAPQGTIGTNGNDNEVTKVITSSSRSSSGGGFFSIFRRKEKIPKSRDGNDNSPSNSRTDIVDVAAPKF